MGFRALVIEDAVKMGYRGGSVCVKYSDGNKKMDFLDNSSTILISSPRTYISSYLLSECAKRNIPVIFCNEKYLPVGHSIPLFPVHNCAEIVKGQIKWGTTIKKQLWQHIVVDKISKQSAVSAALGAESCAAKLKGFANEVKTADNSNREAVASRFYFKEVFEEGFTRRLENDINPCLNFGYAVMLSKIAREILSHGYSTIFGIFHDSKTNQWNLASDFIEPFRPLIDYMVLTSENKKLDKAMKVKLLGSFEKPIRYRNANRKLSTVVEMMVADYLDVLEREQEISELDTYELPCLED